MELLTKAKERRKKNLNKLENILKKKTPHQIIVKGFALTNSTTSPSTGKK